MKFVVNHISPSIVRIAIALFFAITYSLCYVFYLNHYFEYAGFTLYWKNIFFILLSGIISIIPIIFYNGLKTISSIISLFIYILLYVPTILTFALGANLTVSQILLIQFVFMCMMSLFFAADKYVLIRNFNNRKFTFISARLFLILTIISILYIYYTYRGNFAFVSFSDVYAHRAANNTIGTDTFSRYLISWFSTLFVPICLIYGIMKKKTAYFIVGCVGCCIVYMATAAKLSLLMPVILTGIYFILHRLIFNRLYSYLMLLLSLSILILLIISPQPGTFVYTISALLMWRVVGNGGYLNMWYYDYFTTHPQTHYSHIRPINLFTNSYPYGDLQLGQVVGEHYWTEMNANSSFWATDGFAAYGLTGVIICSMVFLFILIFLNTITNRMNKVFLLLLFIPFIMSLLNTSLFSAMWSGGGIFIILFLLFCKEQFYFLEK